mgnify:CR=1 FL=1
MSMDGRKPLTWVQCQTCGKIYQVPREISIEELYIITRCSTCGVTKSLNLGRNKDDIYDLYDINLDPRYY